MRNYLYSLLTLALACVASSALAAGGVFPADDYKVSTHFNEGPTPVGKLYEYKPSFYVGDLFYKIVDGGVELTRRSNGQEYAKKSITIPESVTFLGETYPVIGIGDGVFQFDYDLSQISLPEGVRYIGEGAFFCTLNFDEIHLPSTIESIGANAFAYSSLSSINLTTGVTGIGGGAFAACKNLKSLTCGTNLSNIGKNAIGTYSYGDFVTNTTFLEFVWYTPLTDLYCLESVPPFVDETLANEISYGNKPYKNLSLIYDTATLHVPVGSEEVYKQTAPWSQFKRIYGDGETGISETIAEAEGIRLEGGRIVGEGVMDVYDLGGRQIARGTADQLPTLPAGFYVVRNSQSTAKVLVH